VNDLLRVVLLSMCLMYALRSWFPFLLHEVINSLLCGADAVLRTTRQPSSSLRVSSKMNTTSDIEQTNCFIRFDRGCSWFDVHSSGRFPFLTHWEAVDHLLSSKVVLIVLINSAHG